jgi:RimJ/RimL family protein N-acetyltransferase
VILMENLVLKGERLHLRPLTKADCTPRYCSWLNDPEIARFLETRHAPQTLESIVGFVEAVNGRTDEHLFGIFLNASAEHIGNIKVGPVRQHHPVADVSLLIGERSAWGKGYGRDAIWLISRHAFQDLKLHKLSASMYVENVGSTKAFLAAGYRQEGLRREHMQLDGRMTDLVELGCLAGDLNPSG